MAAARVRGSALVICLFMLVVIGLGAMIAMRGSVVGEKAVNNLRQEALAQEYAELALRWCEMQLTRDTSDRAALLKNIDQSTPIAPSAVVWNKSSTWTTAGVAIDVAAAQVTNATYSSFTPKLPQCLVERIALPVASGGPASVPVSTYLITSRGFSPSYAADARTGATTSGSVVWLQSTVTIQSIAAGGAAAANGADRSTN